MTAVRAVCFDLDGTLLRDDHVDEVVGRVAEEVARRYGLDPASLATDSRSAWAEYWLDLGESWMLGTIPTDAIPLRVWSRVLSSHGIRDEHAAHEAYTLQLTLEGASLRLYEESLDVLAALRARGIRLALITNGPSGLQRGKLAAVGLADAFDAVIVSGEVGVQKPDPAIFRLALDGLGVAAGEALHIGDNQVADVIGARDAGLTAVWVDRSGAERSSDPHAVVTDLRGLLALV